MNLNIVIVDDDAVVLFLHKILMQKCSPDSTIHDFKRGNEALNFIAELRKNSADAILILLDINMPGINGWQFLEQLQNISKEKVFVVMVTSSINSADKKKAAEYPLVLDFLEKPLSKEACNLLHEKVASYISTS